MTLEASLSPYDRFLSSIENPFTRHQYEYFVQLFCEFIQGKKITSSKLERLRKELRKLQRVKERDVEKVKELEKKVRIETAGLFDPILTEIVKSSATAIEDAIKRHHAALKDEGKSYGSRIALINALTKFFKVNKVKDIDWDELRKVIGEDESEHDDKPYSTAQIQKLMEAADLRKKVIIGILATAGPRRGAIGPLKLKHIEKMQTSTGVDVYSLKIYWNSMKSRYTTFVTPEVTALIDSYLESRRKAGETLTPESPLIREQYDIADVDKPRHITTSTLSQLVAWLVQQSGLKEELAKEKIHLMHAFRKRVYSELVNTGVKEISIKKLVGHSTGLGKSYDRTELSDVLKDYERAIPALTISDAPELQRQVEKLKVEIADVDTMKQSYMEMKLKLEKMEKTYGRKTEDELDRLYAMGQAVREHEKHVENNTQLASCGLCCRGRGFPEPLPQSSWAAVRK